MDFSEKLLPLAIAYGSKGGPEYSTQISTLANGSEQRNINWPLARHKYNLARGLKTRSQALELVDFFHAHRGRAIGFRFRSFLEARAEHELLGVGDAKTKLYQLCKTYHLGAVQIRKPILKPLAPDFKLFIAQKERLNYQLDVTTGQLELAEPVPMGQEIHASFSFDLPVRFDIDYLATELAQPNSYQHSEVPIIEILPQIGSYEIINKAAKQPIKKPRGESLTYVTSG